MPKKIRALGDDIYGFYFSGGGCGGCMIFTFTPLVWGRARIFCLKMAKPSRLIRHKCAAPLIFIAILLPKDTVPAGAASDNGNNFLSFVNGRIGQQSLGAFAIGTLVIQYPDLGFGVTLIPSVDGNVSSFAGGDHFVVTKGAAKLELAKNFLEYVYSPEGQKIMATYGSLPARSDVADSILDGLDTRLKIASDAIAVAKTPYTLQFNDLINSANGPWAAFINAAIYGSDVDSAICQCTGRNAVHY